MLVRALGAGLSGLFLASCASHDIAVRPTGAAPLPPPSAAVGPQAIASATPPPSASAGAPRACGALECLAFATPRAAFEHALASHPRLIALGEAHAQKDAPRVKSTTRRFAEELLPALEGRASDLVIELLTVNGSCGKQTEAEVAERQKPVTEPQAGTNQNQFVALGFVAKKLRIAPSALEPTCDELKAVTAAGDGDIERMLVLIADATVRQTSRLLESRDPKQAIVLYGGALHNDLEPRPGREAWSYGPRLRDLAGGSYVELDLVVPELVKPTPAWQGLPWYAAFEAMGPSTDALLFHPSPSSYVLVFPRSLAAPEPLQPGARAE